MGRVCENGSIFFSDKEYKNLKYKHLNRVTYRKFIDRIHSRIAEKEILNNVEGYILPFRLGLIKIQKRFRPNGIYAAHKGNQKEYNFHSMGHVYSIDYLKTDKSVQYSDRYTLQTSPGVNPNIDLDIFKFTGHRMNLKRPLKAIIKKQLKDYSNATSNIH